MPENTPITAEEAAANAKLQLQLKELGNAAFEVLQQEQVVDNAKKILVACTTKLEEDRKKMAALHHALPADKREVSFQRSGLRFHVFGYAQVATIPDETVDL